MSQDTELQRLSKKQSDRPSWVSDNTNADDTLIEPPQGFRQNQLSIDMTESKPPLNETPSNTVPNRLNMMGNQEEKKPTLYQRFLASIPPAPHIRKTVKASVAVLIGVIFALDAHLRTLFGSSALLITIVTIFFFPVRTIGIQTEAVFLGVLGGLIASAWSILGTFLANLARSPSNPSPIQPGASAVLAVFLFTGTFVLNIIRMKMPKANFACVIACIILTFTMTTSASYNGFSADLTWMFLIPVATSGALCLSVNYALWPDDSINNFLGIFKRTLGNYNTFFKEHSDAFLDPSLTSVSTTLPSVNNRLQDGSLLLIDCKRAVHSEILYSRISDKDCSRLTDAIKEMRPHLHGIGLSTIMKGNYMNDHSNTYFEKFKEQNTIDAFTDALNGIRPAASTLTDLCYKATNEGATRVAAMHYHPRTTLNSILWPFPRLWISKSNSAPQESTVSSRDVKLALNQFEKMSVSNDVFSKFLCMNAADIPRNGPLYLLFLYIHSLKQHATRIVALMELVEDMEERRTHYRLWFPHQTLKKWLRSDEVNTGTGVDLNNYENQMGAELARMSTRPDNRDSDDGPAEQVFGVKKTSTKVRGDPDVTGPESPTQWFFYGIYRVIKWMTDPTTFFALKTGVGVVMLAIPAWRVQDAAWYNQWRGQWAMITLVLWMFPATGFFVFGLIDRIIGSVVGAVLGIVVWEITRGNPYGIAVVCFVLFLPAYYVFFFKAKYRVIALMGKITMLLCLIYEHNYATSGVEEYDQIYTVAGKRLLMVIVGLAASWILVCFPFPQTSRVELRKSLARTIQDIGKAFGILSANAITGLGSASPEQVKGFNQLAIELRRQVSQEYTLLHNSAYEPPLRGRFPVQSYKLLLEKVDNMADLVIGMGEALRKIHPSWRKNIASILWQERKEYLSSILSIIKLMSSTLDSKASLPPYMTPPLELRGRFVNLIEKKIMIEPRDIADPSFPSYSAYLMNSLVFVDELQSLLDETEILVGVEDPEEWLRSRT